jgi:ABC-2 type transport system ATP-binding protein
MTNAKHKVNPGEVVAVMRDVTVTYDGYLTRALNRVNLEFQRGEITAVLGAKGAGKSTALKVLAGRLGATEGTVKIFGRSPRTAKARVGYLPGKVDANRPAGFVERLMGRKKEPPADGRGVARMTQAILGNRDLLVLDDPFAGLEPVELTEAKAFIHDLVARGKTVILSSDSLMDIKDMCERLVILHEGKVQATGTLPELLASSGAIRFLPAVLPNEIVERVLRVLREELFASSPENKSPNPSSEKVSEKEITVERRDAVLTQLGRPKGSVALPPAKADDAIDHEKLHGLTKPPASK